MGTIVYLSTTHDVAIIKVNHSSPCLPLSNVQEPVGSQAYLDGIGIINDTTWFTSFTWILRPIQILDMTATVFLRDYPVIYRNVYKISPYGKAGNSGSPLINSTQTAIIGLFFGGMPGIKEYAITSIEILDVIHTANEASINPRVEPIVCRNPTDNPIAIMVKVIALRKVQQPQG